MKTNDINPLGVYVTFVLLGGGAGLFLSNFVAAKRDKKNDSDDWETTGSVGALEPKEESVTVPDDSALSELAKLEADFDITTIQRELVRSKVVGVNQLREMLIEENPPPVLVNHPEDQKPIDFKSIYKSPVSKNVQNEEKMGSLYDVSFVMPDSFPNPKSLVYYAEENVVCRVLDNGQEISVKTPDVLIGPDTLDAMEENGQDVVFVVGPDSRRWIVERIDSMYEPVKVPEKHVEEEEVDG